MSDKITFTPMENSRGRSRNDHIANSRGLTIPHLCHKPAPGYRPDGNCCACMVEVDGERTLVASYSQLLKDGGHNHPARAETARKMVVEMLADQPERCGPHKSSHLGTWLT